jgi:hypothetical protein
MISNNEETVLITGASSGIGLELAKLFSKDGYNLILVARRENKLAELAEEVKKKYSINVHIIKEDLSKIESVKNLFLKVQQLGIRVTTLVNNAGTGYCGLFHEIDIDKDEEMIGLNIEAITYLTKLFSKEMIKLRKGSILNVASTGSYEPGPYIAVYYASKAYVLSFSQALENELKPYGIKVCTLCPGATRTGFSKNSGKKDIKNAMSAEKTAKIAYREFIKNKSVIIPGFFNKIAVLFCKLLPGKVSAGIVRKIQETAAKNF